MRGGSTPWGDLGPADAPGVAEMLDLACRRFFGDLRLVPEPLRQHAAGFLESKRPVPVELMAVHLLKKDLSAVAALYKTGGELEASNRWQEALEQFEAAAKIDDRFAELQFRLSQWLMKAGRFAEARERFESARDLDALRVRADSRINAIIRQVAAEQEAAGLHFVDAERILAESNPDSHGIPGEDLFYEHVHFTFVGNYLLARAVFDQVCKALPQLASGRQRGEVPSNKRCAELLTLTPWDEYQMAASMERLTSRQPFTNQWNYSLRQAATRRKMDDLHKLISTPQAMAATWKTYEAALAKAPDNLSLHLHFSTPLNEDALTARMQRMKSELVSVASLPPAGIVQQFFRPCGVGFGQRDRGRPGIVEHPRKSTGFVHLLEDSLQIQGHIGIGAGQRNADARKPGRQGNTPDFTLVTLIAPRQTNEVMIWASPQQGISRRSDGVLARPQQVDLQQVGLAAQDLALLLPVQLTPFASGSLVPRAEHLDGGDDLLILGQGSNLDEALDDFIRCHGNHPRRIANCGGSPAARQRSCRAAVRYILDEDIRIDVSIRTGDEHPFAERGHISPRQQPIQRRADLTDQQVMHARPLLRVFQMRIHPGKRTGHVGSSRGNVETNKISAAIMAYSGSICEHHRRRRNDVLGGRRYAKSAASVRR